MGESIVIASVLSQWDSLLGSFSTPVWITIALLTIVWVFISFWVFSDTGRWGHGQVAWTLLAALPPLLLIPLGVFFYDLLPLWLLGVLVLPILVMVAYLLMRASGTVCETCGKLRDPSWPYCPFHVDPERAVLIPIPGVPPAYPVVVGSAATAGAAPHAPAPVAPTLGRLVVRSGADRGRDIPVGEDGVILGRDSSCDVCLADESVSSQHARISRYEGRAHLVDLGSTNGTKINGQKIDRAYLYDGDEIEVGDTILDFMEAR